MYEIKAEDTFIQDVNRWSKKVPELWDEIQAITSYMQETGEIPEEQDPHLLTNEELNYVGYFERPYNLMCKDEQFLKVNQNWV